MSKTIVARWQDWAGAGLEHLVLTQAPDGIVAESAIVADDEGERFGASYRVVCDAQWRVRRAEIRAIGVAPAVILSADGEGNWVDGEGHALPELKGAVDIDISATPFTNTLPIRRLDLREGRSAEIVVAYIRMPALRITGERQLYTCLAAGRRYRFEALGSGFTREIDVDGDGLVVTYPDLFRRLA